MKYKCDFCTVLNVGFVELFLIILRFSSRYDIIPVRCDGAAVATGEFS